MLSARGCWKWLALLTLMACNLTRALPTPTPPPTLPPTPLPLGDELQPALTEEPVNPDCPATPTGWILYTVEAGDSMGLLADQTASTVQELVTANCLDNPDQIFVGQVIYLPRQPVISP